MLSRPQGLSWAVLCAAFIVAALGINHSAHAQHFTYGDQLGYYGLGPAPIDFEMPAGYAPGYRDIGFDTPEGDAPGFRDYVNYLSAPAEQGPISYVGNYGGVSDPAGLDNDSINFFRLTDDINEEGIPGAIIIVDPVTGLLSTFTDFSDLHTFNIAFDQVTIQQRSGLRSFDVGAVYWLFEEETKSTDSDGRAAIETVSVLESYNRSLDDGREASRNPTAVAAPPRLPVVPRFSRFAANRRAGGLGLVYGYREFAVQSRFGFDADGGVLGQTSSETEANNWVTGPQAGLVAFKRFGPVSVYAHGLMVAGLNDGDIQQGNSIGAELVPGATNRLLYAQPTRSEHGAAYDELVPTGVLWAEAGLQITGNASVKLAWSATYIDNILLAENRMRYFLPDMGLVDPGNQHLFLHYFFCGIEMVR